ncbi:MAG: hypothetical protein JXR05_07595 [Flavobacteriaceae bacterium]
MKKIIIYSILLFSFQSCLVAQSKTKGEKKEIIKKFINSRLNEFSKNNVFIKDKMIQQYKGSTEGLVKLFTPNQFYFIRNYLDIKTEKDIIRFDTLFSKEEFLSMQEQIKNNSFKKWSELADEKYFKQQKKDKKTRVELFSIPVFNKDRSLIIIYRESRYGGSLEVYKKDVQGNWKRFATGLVWID